MEVRRDYAPGVHGAFRIASGGLNSVQVAAQTQQRLKQQLRKYAGGGGLILDEVGYLPIDKAGADLMFQVLAARYEKA